MCSVKQAKQGRSIAQSNGFGTAGYRTIEYGAGESSETERTRSPQERLPEDTPLDDQIVQAASNTEASDSHRTSWSVPFP